MYELISYKVSPEKKTYTKKAEKKVFLDTFRTLLYIYIYLKMDLFKKRRDIWCFFKKKKLNQNR